MLNKEIYRFYPLVKILDATKIYNKKVKKFDVYKFYLTTGNLDNYKILVLNKVTYRNRPSRANLLVNIDNVIFAKMQATKKNLLIDDKTKDLIVSTGFYVLEPKLDKILPKYLFFIVESNFFQNQKDKFCVGATQKALNNEGLKNLRIPLPSLSIQQKIIERLNAIRKGQELNEKQISLINELFQSLLHQELKPKKNWQIKKLKEVAAIHYGKGLARSERKENGKIFAYGSNGPVYKTDKILINSPTIVIGRKGAVGAVHLVETPCWPIDTTFYTEILDSNLIDLKFLYFILLIKKLEKMAIVTAVPGINRDHLYNITLCIPSIIIQHQIVKKLSTIQDYKKKLLKQKELLQELFESTLNKAMKGELVK